MKEGIELIQSNDNVKLAFQYINYVILDQQLRYALPEIKWISEREILKDFPFRYYSGAKFNANELTQYRNPVGFGPSSNI